MAILTLSGFAPISWVGEIATGLTTGAFRLAVLRVILGICVVLSISGRADWVVSFPFVGFFVRLAPAEGCLFGTRN